MVTKKDLNPVVEPTAIEVEVAAEATPVEGQPKKMFVVEVAGESIEVEDRWDRPGQIPPLSVMMMSDEMVAKFSGPIILQLIGEDQLFDLVLRGLDQGEYIQIINAWAKSNNLGK